METDKDDRSQSLSTTYVPVTNTLPHFLIDFNAFIFFLTIGIVSTNSFGSANDFIDATQVIVFKLLKYRNFAKSHNFIRSKP